jgi:hypothetical protein
MTSEHYPTPFLLCELCPCRKPMFSSFQLVQMIMNLKPLDPSRLFSSIQPLQIHKSELSFGFITFSFIYSNSHPLFLLLLLLFFYCIWYSPMCLDAYSVREILALLLTNDCRTSISGDDKTMCVS